MNTPHPCVVTIDHRSKPRYLFSGDQLVEVDLPVGTRVVYPKPPLKGLDDVDAAIRYSINHPYGCEPLYAMLKPGMKITIALDDISLPLPPMKTPDVRQRMLDIFITQTCRPSVSHVCLSLRLPCSALLLAHTFFVALLVNGVLAVELTSNIVSVFRGLDLPTGDCTVARLHRA